MKKIVLVVLFFSLFSFGQKNGAGNVENIVPPPPGIGCPNYDVIDIDSDGYAQVQLANVSNYIKSLGFRTWGHNLSGYSLKFYHTSSERDSNTNAIAATSILSANNVSYYMRLTFIGGGPQIVFQPNYYNCVTIFFSTPTADPDQDGIPNLAEDLNNNGEISDDDTDGTGWPNYGDNDDDGDGILTINEDYNGNGNPADDDMNANGIPDYLDNSARGSLPLNLKLFIESYYTGSSTMASVKFNQDGVSPLTDVEYVTVELHHATAPFALAATTTAMLKTNGTAECSFPTASVGSYYIAVKSTNSIQTWSATPQAISNTAITYNFSTAATKAFGSNMKHLGNNVYGFYSGDLNNDDNIDASDAVDLTNDILYSAYGNLATDLNGDGSVDASDLPQFDNNVSLSVYTMRPE